MTPIIRYHHWLPRLLGVEGITLVPFILFSLPKEQVQEFMLKHELTHAAQVKRVGWFKFYWSYLQQYHVNRKAGMFDQEAYRAISYEAEAYANQLNPLTEDERKLLA